METMKGNGQLETGNTGTRPVFSICHTTARPEGWQASAREWIAKAKHPEQVEYVLCVDERWGFNPNLSYESMPFEFGKFGGFKLVWNTGRKCMVDGFNTATAAATGQILILNSDDMFPEERWDVAIQRAIKEKFGLENAAPETAFAGDFVVHVSSASPADARGLMVLQILSRTRYEKLGYALYPGYTHLFADNDFTEHAKHDGVVIDARHITVEHRHPDWSDVVTRDVVYMHDADKASWDKGATLLTKRRASGFQDDFDTDDEDTPGDDTPILFSLVHASARPGKWREIFNSWVTKITPGRQSSVEYILVVDERWGFSTEANHLDGPDKVLWNDKRRCCVDSWNLGAAAARGKVIILVADDTTPPDNWDLSLRGAIAGEWDSDFVLHVNTGTRILINGEQFATGLLMLSKARHDRLGYALAPEYSAMFSDVEFWLRAKQDGVIIDATSLTFPHDHPILKCKSQDEANLNQWKQADEVYSVQNSDADYAEGERIFRQRMGNNWQSVPAPVGVWLNHFDPSRKSIAVCLAGEHFCCEWMIGWTGLLVSMLNKFNVSIAATYSSNVYLTRQKLLNETLAVRPEPDYVLCIDDDNTLRIDQLEMLIADLEARPEAGGVFAWTLVRDRNVKALSKVTLSCGAFQDGEHGPVCSPVPLDVLRDAREANQLVEVGYSGFPAVVFRRSTLVASGPNPFMPLVTPDYAYGFAGEDASFCYTVGKRTGCKWYVDPRVQIPHYKTLDEGSGSIDEVLDKVVIDGSND